MSLRVGDSIGGANPFVPTVPGESWAKAADGGLVREGVPYSNGPLARLWRLPSQFIAVPPALAWGIVVAGFAAGWWLYGKLK